MREKESAEDEKKAKVSHDAIANELVKNITEKISELSIATMPLQWILDISEAALNVIKWEKNLTRIIQETSSL